MTETSDATAFEAEARKYLSRMGAGSWIDREWPVLATLIAKCARLSQDVAGSTPAGTSTVAGSRMPEGEWECGLQPQAVEDSRKSPLYLPVAAQSEAPAADPLTPQHCAECDAPIPKDGGLCLGHTPDARYCGRACAMRAHARAQRPNDLMAEAKAFQDRHIMCSQGVTSAGLHAIYKHDSDCEHQAENVGPRAPRTNEASGGNTHDLNCDTRHIDPAIGRATKPCNCERRTARFLTVINREQAVEALPWATYADAMNYFEPAQTQWSESFFCEVLFGPRDVRGMTHPAPRVDNPVDDYKAALEEIYKNTSCSETKRRARRAIHGAPPGPPPLPWVPGVTGKPSVEESRATDWRALATEWLKTAPGYVPDHVYDSLAKYLEKIVTERTDAASEELRCIKSYLGHFDQDCNHAWMVRRIDAVLAGKDPSTVQGWTEHDGVRAPRMASVLTIHFVVNGEEVRVACDAATSLVDAAKNALEKSANLSRSFDAWEIRHEAGNPADLTMPASAFAFVKEGDALYLTLRIGAGGE